MKKLLIMLVLCVGIFLPGCTVNENLAEATRRRALITDLQLKMAVEDSDYFWLYERNSGATQWHPWVGI